MSKLFRYGGYLASAVLTWITATALTTALNTAFLAEQIAIFAIVMGVALLLTGIGFLVLTYGALRSDEEARARRGVA